MYTMCIMNLNKLNLVRWFDFKHKPYSWASAGEGKKGHLPPLAGQNSMFFDFFE